MWVSGLGLSAGVCEPSSDLFSAAEPFLKVPERSFEIFIPNRTLRLTTSPPLSSLSLRFYLNSRWLLQLLPQPWARQSSMVLFRRPLQKNHRSCQASTSTADSFVSRVVSTMDTMLIVSGLRWRSLLLSDTRWSHTRRCVSRKPHPAKIHLRISSLRHPLTLSQRQDAYSARPSHIQQWHDRHLPQGHCE